MHKLTVEEMNRISVEEFRDSQKLPLVIVLDNIRSAYNVGSIFRTADAFRIEKIVLCGISPVPPSVEIHKTALGAEDSVDWEYESNPLDALKKLREEGYSLLAVEQVVDSIKLNDWHLDNECKCALVVGNEVKGVAQEVVDFCDDSLEIPQFGTKHSLNVSCTASIVMWEFLSQKLKCLIPS